MSVLSFFSFFFLFQPLLRPAASYWSSSSSGGGLKKPAQKNVKLSPLLPLFPLKASREKKVCLAGFDSCLPTQERPRGRRGGEIENCGLGTAASKRNKSEINSGFFSHFAGENNRDARFFFWWQLLPLVGAWIERQGGKGERERERGNNSKRAKRQAATSRKQLCKSQQHTRASSSFSNTTKELPEWMGGRPPSALKFLHPSPPPLPFSPSSFSSRGRQRRCGRRNNKQKRLCWKQCAAAASEEEKGQFGPSGSGQCSSKQIRKSLPSHSPPLSPSAYVYTHKRRGAKALNQR